MPEISYICFVMKIILCQSRPYISGGKESVFVLLPSASLLLILVYILVHFSRLCSLSKAPRNPQFIAPKNVGFLESALFIYFVHSH